MEIAPFTSPPQVLLKGTFVITLEFDLSVRFSMLASKSIPFRSPILNSDNVCVPLENSQHPPPPHTHTHAFSFDTWTWRVHTWSEASILGEGGQGGSHPINENIGGGQTYRFAPPPPPPIISTTWKFIICNAKICLKSTVRHYKTINFNIKILLNIHHLLICGALRAQIYIATLRADRA